MTLQRLGVAKDDIFEADSAEDALKIFEKERPGVVLIDMNLAGERGEDAAARILMTAPATKVVVVTGLDRNDARVRKVVSDGAYDVVEKPIRVARLQQLLELVDSEEKGLRRVR